jgi:riboflavin kinase/FMN adenylyltransferase
MQLHKDITKLPSLTKAVLTIGSFDGVHLGHNTILHQLTEAAKAIDGTSVVISFFPHPKLFLGQNNDKPIALLNTIDEKVTLMEKSGVDHLVLVPFTAEFASMEAEAYISDFLVKFFHPHIVIIGHDHRFGKNRSGDFNLMKSCGIKYGFQVLEIPEYVINNIGISSTTIRNKLKSGDVTEANELLGYQYSFTGTVIKGNQMGRTIGFPTANLSIEDDWKLIPCNGVYAVSGLLKEKESFKGMMNIGNRPTFDGKERNIEVHIFEFDKEIYNEKLTVNIVQKIRDEIKFTNINELQAQLKTDQSTCLQLLNHLS